MAYWQPIRGLMDPIPIRQFKGVYNSDDDGFNLNDGFATDGYNMSFTSYPALGVRPGYSLVGTSFGSRVQGIGAWKETELHAISNGVWKRWDGSNWQQIASGLSTTAVPSWTNFKGNLSGIGLFMANGVDQLRVWEGTTVQTVSGAPAGLNFIQQHDNRMYGAIGNTVRYSALSKYNDWTTAGETGEIGTETTTGETISGMIAGPKRLTVFKPNAIFDLFGSGPKSFELKQTTNDIGAINNNCIVNLGGLIYFLHTTGVYVYGGASRPRNDFSLSVRNYIKRINPAAINKCSIGTDGKNLYVSIPLDSATEADTILEYSADYDMWNVWKGYAPTMIENINTTMYIANMDGTVRKVGGTTDNGAPIPFQWVSKPFTASTMARPINFYKVWSIIDLPAGSSMSVSLSKFARGNSDWQMVKSFTSTNDIQKQPLHIPVNMVAYATFVRIKIEGSGQARLYELTRQYREMPWR